VFSRLKLVIVVVLGLKSHAALHVRSVTQPCLILRQRSNSPENTRESRIVEIKQEIAP